MPLRHKRAKEKIRGAVYRLAVGEGDVRSRLVSAYWLLKQLSATDLPPQLLEPWNEVIHDLTLRGPLTGPDGDVWKNACEHTMSHLRNSSGRKIAEKVYALMTGLEHLRRTGG